MEQTELLILDGGFGTMLQAQGLPAGTSPELWNIVNPEAVIRVHRDYIAAGSRVIYANTFGANGRKLRGGPYGVGELVTAGVRAARIAAGDEDVRVALDIGPLGALLAPLGDLGFEEAYALFREVALAGARAGADLAVVETMSDLLELKAALLAVKENTSLPVWTTMTFESGGRTFTGCSVAAFALTASALGADALGFNCSLGPAELLPLVREAAEWTDKPLILKPNAGLPDPVTGEYGLAPADFAAAMREAAALGVTALGGCCGTTPVYIAALREALAEPSTAHRPPKTRRGVCSDRAAVEFGPFRVIGERINPTGKKRFQQALREHDLDYILNCAVEQEEAGAEILDVNVGLPGVDEPEMMCEVVTALQSVTALPLMLDSSDPAAIEAGLRCVRGRAIVNSVNGDRERLDAVLPLCKKYGGAFRLVLFQRPQHVRNGGAAVLVAAAQRRDGIIHDIRRADAVEHGLVVEVIAEGHDLAEVQTEHVGELADAVALVGGGEVQPRLACNGDAHTAAPAAGERRGGVRHAVRAEGGDLDDRLRNGLRRGDDRDVVSDKIAHVRHDDGPLGAEIARVFAGDHHLAVRPGNDLVTERKRLRLGQKNFAQRRVRVWAEHERAVFAQNIHLLGNVAEQAAQAAVLPSARGGE